MPSGQGLAHARGTLSKHGVKQVDRLLSNTAIELDEFFSHWVAHVIGAREEIVVALDWTSFARDGHDTLMLSMLTEHGRATALMWETVSTATLKDNRNRYEDELLYRFSKVVPDGVQVTVVAERGFADCNLFKYLNEDLEFGYVIRLPASYYVTSHSGERRLASQWVGPAGRTRTLRGAQVTDAHLLTVGTVVCLRDKDMKTLGVWWPVTANAPPRLLVQYYAKRWGIETSFRDLKDLRYGLGLSSMRTSCPERRDRLLLLSVLAIALLSLLGAAGERIGYDRWLKVNTVKHRTHSLFRQGLMLYEHIPNWPPERLRPLPQRIRRHAGRTHIVQENVRHLVKMPCSTRSRLVGLPSTFWGLYTVVPKAAVTSSEAAVTCVPSLPEPVSIRARPSIVFPSRWLTSISSSRAVLGTIPI